ISFELNPGDRLAVIGENGSGKTSLLNYFLGNFKGEVQGEITIDRQWQLSYVRQNFEENTGTIATFCQKNKINEEQFLNQIRKLGVERHVFNNKIEHMSQGQQKRIEIAKALVTPANIFIWDEPLNYLDAFNYKQLEQTILKTQPTMIVIDHDSHFLTKIATKVIELKK
ncbi:MAG: ABC-F family ATP-binding cassette domain-containing protein, partial [Enterococcus sp.]|nr:ABC-F family ATP-binding cassette domain-containing protein [Enterococcus sp.]